MAIETSGTGTSEVTVDGTFLNGNSALSVVLWVKSDVTATDKGFLYTYTTFTGGTDQGTACRYDAAGASGGGSQVIKCCIDSTSKTNSGYESASLVQTTSLQNLIFQWSAGNQEQLYIDGVADVPTARAAAYGGTVTNCTTLRICRGAKDGTACWDGLVHELRIYNRVLSANEISSIATMRGQDGIRNGLIIQWHGDQDYPGQTVTGGVTDRSGQGRTGTPATSPTFAEDLIHVRRRRSG